MVSETKVRNEMKELFANTWTEDVDDVRVFLLTGTDKALLIDTGMPGLPFPDLITEHTDLPVEVLITHADEDHIGGNKFFDEFYIHPSEMAFYRRNGGNGALKPVFDGDTIDLGGRVLEVIHLPGHTPGSITVLDRNNRCLIGGDPIGVNTALYMFGPERDLDAYIASLTRLLERDDFDFVYPTHGEIKVSRDAIPELIEGAKKILAGELDAEESELYGYKIRDIDAGIARFLCDPGSGSLK